MNQTKISGFVFSIRISWFCRFFQTEQTVNRKKSGFRTARDKLKKIQVYWKKIQVCRTWNFSKVWNRPYFSRPWFSEMKVQIKWPHNCVYCSICKKSICTFLGWNRLECKNINTLKNSLFDYSVPVRYQLWVFSIAFGISMWLESSFTILAMEILPRAREVQDSLIIFRSSLNMSYRDLWCRWIGF